MGFGMRSNSERAKRANPAREHGFIFLGFLVLAIVATWPLALHFTSSLPFEPSLPTMKGGDIWIHYWNLWWVKKALCELHANPFFCRWAFYPNGVSLAHHPLNLAGALLSMPVHLLFGAPAAYNFLLTASFVLAGFFMYILAYEITGSRVGAVVAGFIYTLAPYHFQQWNHLEHVSIEWAPFFLFFFHRLIRAGRDCDLFGAILGFLLVFYTDLYVAVNVAVAGSILFLAFPPRRAPSLRALVIFLAVVGIATLPVTVPMIHAALTAAFLAPPRWVVEANGADLVAFFVPPFYHPLWGQAAAAIYDRIAGFEKIAYLGFVPLVLSAIALRSSGQRRRKWAWGIIAAAGVFFSLGPVLQVGGVFLRGLPMPYGLLEKIPGLGAGRAPLRWLLLFHLGTAVLAAEAFRAGVKSSGRGVLLVALVLLEFFPKVPVRLEPLGADPFYERLRTEPGEFAVIEVPVTEWPEKITYYQTIHERPLPIGIPTFVPRTAYRFIAETPFLRELYNPSLATPEKGRDYYRAGLRRLKENGFRYVIVHEGMLREVTRARVRRLLEEVADLRCEYRSRALRVYRIE
ncbi:MAG: hypothetical protein D6679_11855 [Candidatus Hydrogenedentota bacterium]|nr:MAG: hypothetical protein D6679_11855 [Candidatus Hydrogenedentota bacterium]